MFRIICGGIRHAAINVSFMGRKPWIYTHRQPFLLAPILEAYTKKQGLSLNRYMRQKGWQSV